METIETKTFNEALNVYSNKIQSLGRIKRLDFYCKSFTDLSLGSRLASLPDAEVLDQYDDRHPITVRFPRWGTRFIVDIKLGVRGNFSICEDY